jgi:hypothetical protein
MATSTNFAPDISSDGIPATFGKIIYCDYTNGKDGNTGLLKDRAVKTLTKALAVCTGVGGNVIVLAPGHAETIASAAGINVNVAGVRIIGLGEGAYRPTFTFSATASTMTITAASVEMKNFIVKPSVDSVVSPIVVSAANVTLDYESQDESATVEMVRSLLTTADADNLTVKLKHKGFTTGNACENAIRLVGCSNANIDIDFYGNASVGVVEFKTTLCTNINVKGYIYNEAAALTYDVVATVSNCTWSADIFDGKGGYKLSGGSAAALAADDVSSMAAALAVVDGYHDIPTANAATNAVMRDVIGGKAEAAVGAVTTDKTIMAYTKGILEDTGTTIPATITTLQNSVGNLAIKTLAAMVGIDTVGMFTVAGDVLVRIVGVVGATAITSTSTTTTLALGTTEAPGGIIAASTVNNVQFAATDVWVDSTPADDCEKMSEDWVVIGGGATISLTVSADDILGGVLKLYCWWIPLSTGATVTAVA